MKYRPWRHTVAVVGALALVIPVSGPISVASALAESVPATWSKVSVSRAHGGSLLTASTTGASASFRVRGRSFSLWYLAGPKNGKVAVFVNNKRVKTLDQYSPKTVRRTVVLKSKTKSNVVRVVVLATKNAKSAGTKVNVDAFSPRSTSCSKGCTRNPIPIPVTAQVALTPSEPVWYPTVVPDRGSPQWVVPIGSYVRGQDVLPIDTAVPVIQQAACDQAKKVGQGIVVLSFGKQVAKGTSGFGRQITSAQIIATTQAWAAGLAQCGKGAWEVSIGTSNSGGVTAYNGYMGGIAWGELVKDARAVSDPRVGVSGSVDLEPGWGPSGQARAWVDGYVATTTTRLWNFGSADGCPQSVGKLTCNNGWTIDDVLWVSSHAGANVMAMPQIHTKSGSQARQWAVLAARAIQMTKPLRLASFTVQTAACTQVRSGCPTTGVSAWDGFNQLRAALDAIPSTVGTPIGAPMDIRWGWANGFVIPPAVTPIAALTPTFGVATATSTGFTVQISNYDVNYTWAATNSASGVVTISNTGLVTVTGLGVGVSSTVTVTTARAGYTNGTATSSAVVSA